MNKKTWLSIGLAILWMSGCDELSIKSPCGNGAIDFSEQCDLGSDAEGVNINGSEGVGCDAQCFIKPGWECGSKEDKYDCWPICGNGKLDIGEDCDPKAATEGCNASCRAEIGYTCKDNVCTKTCGNGQLDLGEQCDLGVDAEGNAINGREDAGCDAQCFIVSGWSCAQDGKNCAKTCGNGQLDLGEQCDDGNIIDGDGCSSICAVEPGWSCAQDGDNMTKCEKTCGNGKLDLGEQCDDGDIIDGDGCSSICAVEPGWSCAQDGDKTTKCEKTCGNGQLDLGEQCDLGMDENGVIQNGREDTGCDARCFIVPGWSCAQNSDNMTKCEKLCGNGTVDPGEDCDYGELPNQKTGCTDTCKAETGYFCENNNCMKKRCNDGVFHADYKFESPFEQDVKLTEQCDDGNATAGDGCDPQCQIEPFFEMRDGVVRPICGDGVWLREYEACDDGNNIDGDGCSANCEIEDGYVCDERESAKLKENISNSELNGLDIIPVETIQRDFLRIYENSGEYDVNIGQKYLAEMLEDEQCKRWQTENCNNAICSDQGNLNVNENQCNANDYQYAFTEKPNHPDFGGCRKDGGANPIAQELDKNGKPRYVGGSGNVLCKKSFDIWFDDHPYYNRKFHQYLLFAKQTSWRRYRFIADGNGDNRKFQYYLTADANKKSGYKLQYFSDRYYPINELGFHSGNSSLGNNDGFTSELTGYIYISDDSNVNYEFNSDDDSWTFINNQLVSDLSGYHGLYKKDNKLDNRMNDIRTGKISKLLKNKEGQNVVVNYYPMIKGFHKGYYPMKVFYAERGGGSGLVLFIPDLVDLSKSACSKK